MTDSTTDSTTDPTGGARLLMAEWTEELCSAVNNHTYVDVPCCLDGADTTCLECLSMDYEF